MATISGCGAGVIDYLYVNLDFNSESFKKYQQKRPGDGGLNPGHLSFVKDLEKFAGKPLKEVQKDQGWDRVPDKYNLGGPSVVALVNAAQLTAHIGGKVKYFGAIARDETGQRILEVLKKTPIDLTHYGFIEGKSPFCICLSDPNANDGHGERCFAIEIGTMAQVKPSMLGDAFYESDILYFGATALCPGLHEGLTEMLKKGHKMGRVVAVGTVFDHLNEAKNPSKRWPMGASDESFKYMDVLMVDWDEAMRISGKSTLKDAVRFFISKGVKSLTITHGAQPAYAWSSGALFKKMPLTPFPICKQVTADLKANPSIRGDTTGCGDNFAGGVLAYLSEAMGRGVKRGQLDLHEAMTWGTASGGFACFSIGGTYLEDHVGQKRIQVEKYRQAYLKQLSAEPKL